MGEPASALQEAMIRCCDTSRDGEPSCHPLFLALCADIALNTHHATGRLPPPETFAGIPERALANELAARFLTSLHSGSMEYWVKDLSLTPRFDEAAALALDAARQHHNGRAGWDRLARLSFVERQADGFCRLHKIMRDVLRAQVETGGARPVHEWFETHWKSRRKQTLAWFHAWTLDPESRLEEWTRQHGAAIHAAQSATARELLALWSELSLDDGDRRAAGDELWARTHYTLGRALLDTPLAPRRAALAAAIEHLRAATTVYTRAAYPSQWANTQNTLGVIHGRLPTGTRDESLRVAIACYEAALGVYTEAGFPKEWAMVQLNLGTALAALHAGDRAQNLRAAIACYDAALRIYTEAVSPEEWAMVQTDLGVAYIGLLAGDREQNVRRAIECFEAALRVYTKAHSPHAWAKVQGDLGTAHGLLPGRGREESLRAAIACHDAALGVYTETDFPEDWATVQFARGATYHELRAAEHEEEHLQQAIASYDAALRVFTEADFPQQWVGAERLRAGALLLLGRMRGDRAILARARDGILAAQRGYSAAGQPDDVTVAGTLAEIDEAIDALASAGNVPSP
jgi:tetratricopeptide (TPR) repeat protein